AGPLVAAQPGVTAADPVVAVLWGVLAFHEQVRGGIWLFLVLVAAGVAAWGVVKLSRSSVITGTTPDGADVGDTATQAVPEEHDQRRTPTR
ncbi:MAG TPA: hypothetical protein VE152_13425, partial [Acidimicrobiales bacterium]|nr:hypothetical protein [Acidimicrobiales bacterium]